MLDVNIHHVGVYRNPQRAVQTLDHAHLTLMVSGIVRLAHDGVPVGPETQPFFVVNVPGTVIDFEFGASRDGWIAAHNSHLHVIYRAGIVGMLWVFTYLSLLFKMIGQFVRQKSLTGILLCGIIINWFVAANFLVTLELPYTAIPIWALFGLTVAYSQERLKHELEK